jgi:hypothetical protein
MRVNAYYDLPTRMLNSEVLSRIFALLSSGSLKIRILMQVHNNFSFYVGPHRISVSRENRAKDVLPHQA